ncbi:MAG: LacI family DNA-binding transcriptional regulator [Anaerolineae bacterium]
MPVTLKDIAKEVGFSVTTVSRALNDYDDVREETKRKIRQVAQEMGYYPNVTAQRLQKRRTDTVGFIIPTFGPRFSDPFFSELLAGIGNEAAKHEFDLLVSTRAPGPEELSAYQRKVKGKRVDGLLVVRTRCDDERITYLVKNRFPFVAYGRSDLPLDFPYLDVDGRQGLEQVTQHLIDLGHQRIAHITAPSNLMFTVYRDQGYRAALERNGIPLDERLIVVSDLTERGGFEAARALLGHDPPPTAIIADNDLMALGAISVAQKLGMVVGQGISITGFDDIPIAAHSHPPLTTVRQPIYDIGRRICRMLIQVIKGEELAERHILLQPELVVRESSGLFDLRM